MRKYTVQIPSPFLGELNAKNTIEKKQISVDLMLEVDHLSLGENPCFKNQAISAIDQRIKGWYQYYSVNYLCVLSVSFECSFAMLRGILFCSC